MADACGPKIGPGSGDSLVGDSGKTGFGSGTTTSQIVQIDEISRIDPNPGEDDFMGNCSKIFESDPAEVGSAAGELIKGSARGNLNKESATEVVNTQSRSQLFYSLLTSNKREEKKLRNITFRTLLLLTVSPIVLWFSHDEPLLVVWRLALLLCYGCFFWTNFLAQTLKRGTVFGYITYGLLLASWADGMLNPGMSVFIVHLSSHFATGLVGFALAERLEHQSINKSTFEVSIPTSEEEERLSVFRFFGGLALAGPMLGVIGGILWLVCHSADYVADLLVLDTLVVLPLALVFGIIIVAAYQLRGATISPDRISFVVLYFVFVIFLRAGCKVLLSNVVAMIITWVAVMFLSGLLGYCVGVVASSKHILRKTHLVGD